MERIWGVLEKRPPQYISDFVFMMSVGIMPKFDSANPKYTEGGVLMVVRINFSPQSYTPLNQAE
jgi:hypothetical protein